MAPHGRALRTLARVAGAAWGAVAAVLFVALAAGFTPDAGGTAPAATTTTAGVVKLGTDVEKCLVLAVDQVEDAATLEDAVGLAFTPAANAVYRVRFFGIFQTNVVGNGFQYKFVAPTGGNFAGMAGFVANTGTGFAFRAGPVTTGNLGVAAGTTANEPAMAEVLFETGASPVGDLKLQFNSETAVGNSVTLEAGSYLCYRRML
jgi:hypothetical protein